MRYCAAFVFVAVFSIAAFAEDDPLFPKAKDRLRVETMNQYLQDVDDPTKEVVVESSKKFYYPDGEIRSAPTFDRNTGTWITLWFEHDFDDKDRPTKRTAKDDNGQVLQTWTYTYEDNKKTVIQEFRNPLGDVESTRTYIYRDEKLRNVIHHFEDEPMKDDSETYTYDKDGKLEKVEHVVAANLEKTVKYYYNEKTGKLVSRKEYRGDGTLKLTATYDDKGMVIESWLYSQNGKQAVMWFVLDQKYDDKDRLTEETWKLYSVSGQTMMRGRRAMTYESWSK